MVAEKIEVYDIMAITSPNHSFAGCKELGIEEISKEPLITLKAGSLYNEPTVDTIFQELSIPYRINADTDDLNSIKSMVAQNLGIGLLPYRFVRRECNLGTLIRIPIKKNPFSPYSAYILYRKDLERKTNAAHFIVRQLKKLNERCLHLMKYRDGLCSVNVVE